MSILLYKDKQLSIVDCLLSIFSFRLSSITYHASRIIPTSPRSHRDRLFSLSRLILNRVLPIFIVITIQSFLNAQTIPEFDSDRAFGYLEGQCQLGPRNPGSEGHQKGLEYIVDVVTPLADSVILQSIPYLNPYDGAMLKLTNIIAQFRPQDKYRIWIAAHWDTRPWADKDKNPENRKTPILGANDGASGVAILLELAHHFSEQIPPVGVDLIFFDGEDMGMTGDLENFFNGSRYLAQHIPTKIPEYCILIDMVGDKELRIPMEKNSLIQAGDLVKELWELAQDLGFFQFVSVIGPAIADDHLILFEGGGIPTIDIIDFDYPNRWENYWHTLEDTPDKCSSESLYIVGMVLLHHIYEIE